ncbi:chorismate mutase [Photorhabdus khanii]|uniref:chorismate mutase n=2 Tax=Morganellaceae TaxID=1903414 RepID=A0A7C9GIS6_9GAMM|nr:chorismate mutase [Photorhabdus khanii]
MKTKYMTQSIIDKQDILQPHRESLDVINMQILALLSERMKICMKIAEIKAEQDIPMMQPQRITSLLAILRDKSTDFGLRSEYTESIFQQVIEETCRREEELIDQLLHEKAKNNENTAH